MKNKKAYILLPLLLLGACTYYKQDNLYPATIVTCVADTLQQASFAKNIVPIFKANCAISGCHTGVNAAGNLDLDSAVAYNNLTTGGAGYINTSNPQLSVLYNQMISTSDPMPPTGLLDKCTTGLVLKWIEQKAPNN